eukprot:7554619-Alexandrium_andersonii.AAC.1
MCIRDSQGNRRNRPKQPGLLSTDPNRPPGCTGIREVLTGGASDDQDHRDEGGAIQEPPQRGSPVAEEGPDVVCQGTDGTSPVIAERRT